MIWVDLTEVDMIWVDLTLSSAWMKNLINQLKIIELTWVDYVNSHMMTQELQHSASQAPEKRTKLSPSRDTRMNLSACSLLWEVAWFFCTHESGWWPYLWKIFQRPTFIIHPSASIFIHCVTVSHYTRYSTLWLREGFDKKYKHPKIFG